MTGTSKIEWTEQTWNPIVGCSIVSPGCTNCYAMQMASRIEAMGNQPRYAGTTKKVNGKAVWTGKLAQAPESVLLAPLKRRKPTTYFVNSMGDLFHEDVPNEWIDRVFAVMALCPQHTFQVLTKRAGRMRSYMASRSQPGPAGDEAPAVDIRVRMTAHHAPTGKWAKQIPWPLPNVWLGVSTERQQEADERIPDLLGTPAAVRFVSAEPLLGPIDLKRWMPSGKWGTFKGEPVYHQTYFMTKCERCGWFGSSELCPLSHNADDADVVCPGCNEIFLCDEVDAKLGWLIAGGESGHGARPMHPDWARGLRDQCAAADVPFFMKQWGEFGPCGAINVSRQHALCGLMGAQPTLERNWMRALEFFQKSKGVDGAAVLARVGKKAAGRLLDGIEHNGMPERRA